MLPTHRHQLCINPVSCQHSPRAAQLRHSLAGFLRAGRHDGRVGAASVDAASHGQMRQAGRRAAEAPHLPAAWPFTAASAPVMLPACKPKRRAQQQYMLHSSPPLRGAPLRGITALMLPCPWPAVCVALQAPPPRAPALLRHLSVQMPEPCSTSWMAPSTSRSSCFTCTEKGDWMVQQPARVLLQQHSVQARTASGWFKHARLVTLLGQLLAGWALGQVAFAQRGIHGGDDLQAATNQEHVSMLRLALAATLCCHTPALPCCGTPPLAGAALRICTRRRLRWRSGAAMRAWMDSSSLYRCGTGCRAEPRMAQDGRHASGVRHAVPLGSHQGMQSACRGGAPPRRCMHTST